jgi:hypothetical protein
MSLISYHNNCSIVTQINQMKGIYDQLYHLEELYQKFPEDEQIEVKQMIDPTR